MVMGIHVIASLREAISDTTRRLFLFRPLRFVYESLLAFDSPLSAMVARNDIILLFIFSLLISSCSTSTPPSTPQVVSVYSSSFTQPWLADVYACAGTSVIVRVSETESVYDIRLQLGEPEFLSGFAYQIDTEEILIVTNRVSPIQNLTLEQAQALFMGLGDPAVQVWVYASEAEMQIVFDQFVMKGRSVTSSARVAVSPQQMSDTLVSESNAVGILSRRWVVGDAREIYLVAKVPVLAITQTEPVGVVKSLLACLQK